MLGNDGRSAGPYVFTLKEVSPISFSFMSTLFSGLWKLHSTFYKQWIMHTFSFLGELSHLSLRRLGKYFSAVCLVGFCLQWTELFGERDG